MPPLDNKPHSTQTDAERRWAIRASVATTIAAIVGIVGTVVGILGGAYGYNAKALLDQASATIDTRTRERDEKAQQLNQVEATLRGQLSECQDQLSQAKAAVVSLESRSGILERDLEATRSQLGVAGNSLVETQRSVSTCSTLLAQERPVPIRNISLQKDAVHTFTDPHVSLKYERFDSGSITILVDGRLRYAIPVEFGAVAFPIKFDETARAFLGLHLLRFSDANRRLMDASLVRFPAKCTFLDLAAEGGQTTR